MRSPYLLSAAEVVAIVISVSRETVIEARSVLCATNLIATVAIVIAGTVTVWLSGVAMVARALASTSHPVLVQIVPARFCNLACTYCNEYDDFSDPVPIAEMERRIDELGRLGTSVITISGGEPLMHPDLDEIIRRIRKTGA